MPPRKARRESSRGIPPSSDPTGSAERTDVAALEERLREKTLEAEALRSIGQAIGLMLDLPQMLQRVAEIIAHVTGTDFCLIYLLSENKTELVLRATNKPEPGAVGKIVLKMGEGVTGWVANTRKIVALDKEAFRDSRFKLFPELKEQRYSSLLSVPLLGKEELIGVLNVKTHVAHRYTPAQISLLQSISQQVAGAIENSNQYQKIQLRASRLSTLSEISRTISSSLYLEEILQFIVAVTAESMNLSICSVMLLDQAKSELIIKATTSQSRAYIKKPNLRLGESLAGKAAQEGRSVQVLDVRKTPGYRYPDIAKQEGLCSLVCVPMPLKGRIIGVLNCYTNKPHLFTEEEVQLLQALASHAAIAIENSQLHVRSAILQEMHHRVKNNLQTVASLLRLQMRYAKKISLESALSESISRIQAIAVVHDMLSREDLDRVSVRKLAETILSAHAGMLLPSGHKIDAVVDGPDIQLASHHATSVALVLNELVQNAVEHGLKGYTEGALRVDISAEEGLVSIGVSNSGNALPEGFAVSTHKSLGLQIVENLVREELGGTFELFQAGDTCARFCFRV